MSRMKGVTKAAFYADAVFIKKTLTAITDNLAGADWPQLQQWMMEVEGTAAELRSFIEHQDHDATDTPVHYCQLCLNEGEDA